MHFVHKPGLERDAHGNYLYNVYVNWGEKTQKKISDKKAADKERYGHPRVKDIEEPEYTEKDSVHSTPAYNRTNKGYTKAGTYEIHHSGDFGAKLYFIDKTGKKQKVSYSYDRVWGDKSETDVNFERSREKNIEALKSTVKELTRSGPKRREYYISLLKQKDEEKSQDPKKEKPVPKNPNWENHQTLELIRQMDTPGHVNETDNHEAALVRRKGNKVMLQFLTEHLKRHYPSAPVNLVEEAARSGNSRFHYATESRTRHVDAWQHAMNTLTRLMKHPPPEKKPAPAPVKFPKITKPRVTLPHSETPGMKRWIRKVTHYFPGNEKQGALDNSVFVNPVTEESMSKTFELEDGLYETAQGPKAGLDSHLIRYHVKNGKLQEISPVEYHKHLKNLPFIPAEEITAKIKRESDAKRKAREEPLFEYYVTGPGTYDHRDWIKAAGGIYDSYQKRWIIREYKQRDKEALKEHFARLRSLPGLNISKPVKHDVIQKSKPDTWQVIYSYIRDNHNRSSLVSIPV